MSFRLQVQKNLTACLEEISPELGVDWWEDIGDPFDLRPGAQGHEHCVFRGRNRFGESDPDELLSILEPPIPLEGFINRAADNTNSNADWELLIQGFCIGDDFHATDRAQQFLEATKKKLRAEMRRQIPGQQGDLNILGLGVGVDPRGSIDKMTIGQGVCRPPDESSERSFFWLLLKLQVVEKAV